MTYHTLLFLAIGGTRKRADFVVVAGHDQCGADDVFLVVALTPHLIRHLIELRVGGF